MTGRLLQYLTQAHIFRCHGDRSDVGVTIPVTGHVRA